jgi:putative toxin-antitoxin system antitoxin component (TIGR02293 family)
MEASLMSVVAERLSEILNKTSLELSDLARILDANPRTVSRWVRDETAPRWESRERLLEFFAVVERLQQVVRPEATNDWLFSPNPALDYEKPVEILRRGDFRRVLGAIDALGEGVFS